MTSTTLSTVVLDEAATQALLQWVADIDDIDAAVFRKAQHLATRLGAHCRADGLVEIGFWAPELLGDMVEPRDIYLEVFTPLQSVDFTQPEQVVQFQRDRVPMVQQGEYVWGAFRGMQIGNREQLGSLYWLRYTDPNAALSDTPLPAKIACDVLAHSLPYGIMAPAEVYDVERLQRDRRDLEFFAGFKPNTKGIATVPPPVNILQLHVNTASAAGSIAGLTRIYQAIAAKIVADEPLTPAEQNYVGYDALQLLPIEPTVENITEEHQFWTPKTEDVDSIHPGFESETVDVLLRKPNTQNWGFDIVIASSSATNPAVLETLRPDELVEFIETLHTFPSGPIHLIYDIVYGHADNQAKRLLNARYLKGPNMYGQDVNHQDPTVRAILLEMQRRKIDTGVDGIRVDGAQDFKFFNPHSGRVEYDNDYLQLMYGVKQTIGPYRRQLFFIFEDGRPWPDEGWEKTSTYLEVIRQISNVYQWGPLIFAHNTPALKNFWDEKWDRICEIMHHGSQWVTGCANHDTMRRGTQVSADRPIDWSLGQTLPEVLHNAYDNPATALLTYGFCPGLPMDFINATMRSPWGFFRNTDDYYGIKVVAEEGGFLDWQVEPEVYDCSGNFGRLKELGFDDFTTLKAFIHGLHVGITQTGFNLNELAGICNKCLAGKDLDDVALAKLDLIEEAASCPLPFHRLQAVAENNRPQFLDLMDSDKLNIFANAYMEDCHDFSNVSHYADRLKPAQTTFNLQLRQFRHRYRWLQANLSGGDRFNRLSGRDRTIFYGLRTEPNGRVPDERPREKIAMVTHMGGEPATITLADWLQIDWDRWEVAISSPGLDLSDPENLQSFELRSHQAALFVPKSDRN
ncbi:MAG: glucosylglycerol hydrolase [Cyanobacteria bacterium J06642_2]